MMQSTAFSSHASRRLQDLNGLRLASFGRRAAALWIDLLLIAYFGLGTYLGRGQTVGKRLLRIRVITLTHARLSLWQCIERAVGYAAYHQTVHDRIAETVVAASPDSHPPRHA